MSYDEQIKQLQNRLEITNLTENCPFKDYMTDYNNALNALQVSCETYNNTFAEKNKKIKKNLEATTLTVEKLHWELARFKEYDVYGKYDELEEMACTMLNDLNKFILLQSTLIKKLKQASHVKKLIKKCRNLTKEMCDTHPTIKPHIATLNQYSPATALEKLRAIKQFSNAQEHDKFDCLTDFKDYNETMKGFYYRDVLMMPEDIKKLIQSDNDKENRYIAWKTLTKYLDYGEVAFILPASLIIPAVFILAAHSAPIMIPIIAMCLFSVVISAALMISKQIIKKRLDKKEKNVVTLLDEKDQFINVNTLAKKKNPDTQKLKFFDPSNKIQHTLETTTDEISNYFKDKIS